MARLNRAGWVGRYCAKSLRHPSPAQPITKTMGINKFHSQCESRRDRECGRLHVGQEALTKSYKFFDMLYGLAAQTPVRLVSRSRVSGGMEDLASPSRENRSAGRPGGEQLQRRLNNRKMSGKSLQAEVQLTMANKVSVTVIWMVRRREIRNFLLQIGLEYI